MFDKVREKLSRASSKLTPASSRSRSQRRSRGHATAYPPRIAIPKNVKLRDDIDRAMAEYSDCAPEDSPTWGHQSPFSVSLSWDGANGLKEIEDLINGTTWSADGSRLGKSAYPCVWTKDSVRKLDPAYVVREARRRVRKWYHGRHARVRKEWEREFADHMAHHPNRPLPRALEKKRAYLATLRTALDEHLEKEKAEATRRVIPLISPALGETTRRAMADDKRRGRAMTGEERRGAF